MPIHIHDKGNQMQRWAQRFSQEHGRMPSEREKSEAMAEMGISRVEMERLRAASPRSLDVPVGEDETTTLGEMLADPSQDPDRELERESRRQELQAVLAQAALSELEYEVLWMAYAEDFASAQIAEELGIPLGKVKSLRLTGMRKCRSGLAHQAA